MNSVERRAVKRYSVDCVAELASGTAVVPAQISDISVLGCGIFIFDCGEDLPDRFGATGLLSLRTIRPNPVCAVIPVMLCNMRLDGSTLHYGLKFRDMTPRQTAKLVLVMSELAEGLDPAALPQGGSDPQPTLVSRRVSAAC